MPKEPKPIRVGIISHRRPETTGFLGCCLALANKMDLKWHIETNADCAPSRNRIVRMTEEPYLLFIDDDMEFEPGDVETIFKALASNPEMGALSALCYKANDDNIPVAYFKDESGHWLNDTLNNDISRQLAQKGVIHEVDGFGAAFLLIDMNVFKKIAFPWFQARYEGNEYASKFTTAKFNNRMYTFARSSRRLGLSHP